MTLARKLYQNPNLNGEAFNFGPNADECRTVLDLTPIICSLSDVENLLKEAGNVAKNRVCSAHQNGMSHKLNI